MRDILFRGKRIDNGEWVEGSLVVWPDGDADICHHSENNIVQMTKTIVSADSVGQYTGLTDKNGKKIFEGDIVKTHYANAKNGEFVEVVVFHNGRFCAEGNLGGTGRSWANLWDGIRHLPQDKCVYMDGVEVIGNIHDNPELLGGVDDG